MRDGMENNPYVNGRMREKEPKASVALRPSSCPVRGILRIAQMPSKRMAELCVALRRQLTAVLDATIVKGAKTRLQHFGQRMA